MECTPPRTVARLLDKVSGLVSCLLQGCVLSVVSFRAAVSVCCLLQGCVLSVVSFRAVSCLLSPSGLLCHVCCLLQGCCVMSVVSFRAVSCQLSPSGLCLVSCLLQGCVLSVVSFKAVLVCCLLQGCCVMSVVSFRAAVSCLLSPSGLCRSVRLSSLVCKILQGSQIAPHVFLFSHSRYAEECSDVWGGL